MERFIREVRRGTKVRDHKFPKEEAVYKLLYLESERQEGRWAERKLKGFSEVCGPSENWGLLLFVPKVRLT